jgi:hypothetical protein
MNWPRRLPADSDRFEEPLLSALAFLTRYYTVRLCNAGHALWHVGSKILLWTGERLNSPWPYAVLWLLAFALAMVGSVYTNHLSKGFYWLTWPGAIWNWGFLLSSMGLAVGVGAQRYHAMVEASSAQAQLAQNIKALQEITITQPSVDFGQEVAGHFPTALSVAFDTLTDEEMLADHAALAAIIGQLLNSVVQLAHEFDGKPAATYSANIMIYYPLAELNQTEKQQLDNMLHFRRAGQPIDALPGALVLDPRLSVPSSFLLPFALPVDTLAVNRAHEALPGAPGSFLAASLMCVADVDDMRRRLATSPIDETIRRQIDEYFSTGAGQQFASFASIPLFSTNTAGQSETIGVININSSIPGVLRSSYLREQTPTALDNGPPKRFFYAVTPQLYLIGLLVRAYDRQRSLAELMEGPSQGTGGSV